MKKQRLDKEMLERGLVRSRSQATALINHGNVYVNHKLVDKAGFEVQSEDQIEITMDTDVVGRGAYKLEHALEQFNINPMNRNCADIGASTGGFTQVLLKHGAKQVVAIDVGHDQLDPSLRSDARVQNWEGKNIRELESFPFEIDLVVIDLSFISITKVMDKIKSLLGPKAELVVLIKPQFEAGKEQLGKDAIIKSDQLRGEILDKTLAWLNQQGHPVISWCDSPIAGKSGNKEYLCHIKYN